jgi:hypothetical protein
MRDVYYKDYQTYIRGLKRLVNLIENSKSDFILRIFIDKNVNETKEIKQILESSHIVEPVLFECVDYMKGDFHMGLFATMMRFFPLFNFENNDRGSVIVTDVDLHGQKYPYLKYWMETKPDHFMAKIAINDLLRGKDLYIMAGGLYFPNAPSHMYDKELLLDFIKNADEYANDNYYKESVTNDTSNTMGQDTPFMYGIDEIFINMILVKKNHLKDIYAISMYSPSHFIYKESYTDKERNIYDKCLKLILGKYDKESFKFKNRLKYIDHIFNFAKINLKDKRDKNTQKYKYFHHKFYELMKNLKKIDKKWFSEPVTKMINDHLMYKNRGLLIIKYDKDKIYTDVKFVPYEF